MLVRQLRAVVVDLEFPSVHPPNYSEDNAVLESPPV
jgi:hypothetical protein